MLHTSKRSATSIPARPDDRDALDQLVARRRHRGRRPSPRDPGLARPRRRGPAARRSRSWSWWRSRGSAAAVRGRTGPRPSSPCRPGAVRSPAAAASTSRRSPPEAASVNGWRDRSAASPRSPRCTARAGAGSGAFVDVSTFEAMTIAFNQFQAVAAQLDGRGPEPEAIGRFVDVPSVEPTADGWVGLRDQRIGAVPRLCRDRGASRVGRPSRVRARRPAAASTTASCAPRSRIDRHTLDRTRSSSTRPASCASRWRRSGTARRMPGFAPFVERDVFVEHPDGDMLQPRVPYRMGGRSRRPFGRRRRAGRSTPADGPRRAARRRVGVARRTTDERRSTRRARSRTCASSTSPPTGRARTPRRSSGSSAPTWSRSSPCSAPTARRMGTAYSSVGDRRGSSRRCSTARTRTSATSPSTSPIPEGLAIARRLLAACDVLIENYTPRVLERFGLARRRDARRRTPA